MNYQEIINNVADKLKLPKEVIKEAYESYWRYIRHTISELPLKEDLNEEEFNKLKTSFNIPSIGKLAVTWDRYKALKDRYKHIKNLRNESNNKESQTHV